MEKHDEKLIRLAAAAGYSIKTVVPLPPSGSPRRYFRLFTDKDKTLIGVFHPDHKENRAHFLMTRHFLSKGLPVPEIYAHSSDFHYFILQDLGKTTLFQYIQNHRETLTEDAITGLFKKAVDDLLKFQTEGIKGFSDEFTYPVAEFNRRSVMWDLNYFKYFFVKTNELSFDENLLEDDFEKLAGTLLHSPRHYFHYRDFQSRNIMIVDEKFYYIDFQGGRRGPLPYDLISLIFQAKAGLTDRQREVLYEYYLTALKRIEPEAVAPFVKYFPDFVFFRLMQVLGAYGFRGLFQRKPHFLESIYPAIELLEKRMEMSGFSVKLPEVTNVFRQIVSLKEKFRPADFREHLLTVEINSFSYKKSGIPYDISPNGGGFVFDCRALPNPGRLRELRDFTGQDQAVIDYLDQYEEIKDFKKNVFGLVEQSIENYLQRGFSRLQVNFGCTGGKHRSVYMAEALREYLSKNRQVQIVIHHREQEKL